MYYLFMLKRESCLDQALRTKKSGDEKLAQFYKHAAEGYKIKAEKMTVGEVLRERGE